MIGKTISHYKILEKLGEGGMGVVYKAKDTKLKRLVALKFLPLELTRDEQAKQRFVHEARAASALDHPNIGTIHEINEVEGHYFIAMAYYEGETLKDKIEQGAIAIEEALDIVIQIAQGLAKAHSKDIVHRDIKPGNVLITEDKRIKIIDFGLAKLAGRTVLTKTGTTMGTVAYMSPEQTQGGGVDHRTDIWALGVMLYEMLTGEHPFKGDYEQAVVYSIMNEKPDPITDLRSEIPMSIEQVVTRALEKNPDNRYQQIDELLDDLKSISAGIVPDEIKLRLRKAKLLKRKKAILYAGMAGFIIIMTVIALSLFTGRAEAIDSIAVLPLENLTGDAGQEYFVDGVTDELIGQLGQISALRVISRQSMMQYRGSDKPLPEIARELNVDAVVEGSVHRVGENVRIRVQLIDALPEERNLWTQTYEQAMTDVLVMYGEMARAIAGEIQVSLTPEEEKLLASARQVEPAAYEACLKGMSHWYKLTPPDLDTALQYFQSALEKDPDYALAHTGIALVWIGRQQLGVIAPSEAKLKAKKAVFKALELDDTLAEAHYALALIRTWSEWDWESGETAFQRALELKPNYPDARVYYSNLLCYMGRPEEALEQAELALELDPLNSLFMGISGLTLLMIGKYDDAIVQARNALRTSPNDPAANSNLWEALHMKGMYEEALTAAKVMFTGVGLAQIAEVMARGYEEDGYSGAMNLVGDILAELSLETYIHPFIISYPYVYAGKKDQALEWLERGYEIGDPNMPYIIEPCFDILRDDPRFQDLLRRMNLPTEE